MPLIFNVGLGIALRNASDSTKRTVHDISDGIATIVRFVIQLAPIDIFGLVSDIIASAGFGALAGYARLLGVLLSSMMIIALIVNPIIVFVGTGMNPYPLVLRCLRESGITPFLPVVQLQIFRST